MVIEKKIKVEKFQLNSREKLVAMKLNLTFMVLITASYLSAITESATTPLNETSNVTVKPKSSSLTTTPAPNFITSTLDNVWRFFFSKFHDN